MTAHYVARAGRDQLEVDALSEDHARRAARAVLGAEYDLYRETPIGWERV